MPPLRALLLIASVAVVLPLHAAITIVIDGDTVTARGLTPRGGAVVFSVAHEPNIAYYTIRRVAELVKDDDGDGVVAYTAAKPVSLRSVWVVVDLRTGAHGAASPEGFPERLSSERRSRAVRGGDGEWSRLAHERPWLELLVVRPGGEVWELTAMRGGAADVERTAGPDYYTPLDRFRPLTPGARPLARLTPADVIVAVDARTIEYFVLGLEE